MRDALRGDAGASPRAWRDVEGRGQRSIIGSLRQVHGLSPHQSGCIGRFFILILRRHSAIRGPIQRNARGFYVRTKGNYFVYFSYEGPDFIMYAK